MLASNAAEDFWNVNAKAWLDIKRVNSRHNGLPKPELYACPESQPEASVLMANRPLRTPTPHHGRTYTQSPQNISTKNTRVSAIRGHQVPIARVFLLHQSPVVEAGGRLANPPGGAGSSQAGN